MNALLDHAWGKSAAQDRVWAQVTGLAPSRAVRRWLMALTYQAFIDDSYTHGGEFVLAGHVATAENWAKFAAEWENLLPSGTLGKSGYHFKMAEMAAIPERMERVPAFYWVVEKYALLSLSCRINLADFERAHERAKSWAATMNWSVDFDRWNNPYYFTFRGLIDHFHISRGTLKPLVPLSELVDFIFDNQTEKSFILSAWDEYLSKRADDIRGYYGATPRFEDDQKFLPLQAADLWAWWVREWYEEDATPRPTRMADFDFGMWRGKKRSTMTICFNEDQIFEMLQGLAIEEVRNLRLSSGDDL